MHTYFTAVNFNASNKVVIRKLLSVWVLSPKRNISISWGPGLWLLGELTHFQEHLCIPLFSFSVPYSVQLALQITNAIKMAPNHDRTLSLAKSQLSLGCIYCVGRNGFKTSAAPSKEHRVFLLHGHLWMSPAVLSIPLWQEGDLQCFHLLWKCLPQPQHSHSHSITRAQQYNSSHWQCRHFKPHYCVQGRHEMWGRDLNAQVHSLGCFQKKGPAFPSTLHATMRQENRAHLQQETPWDLWC